MYALDSAWQTYQSQDRHWRRFDPASELSEVESSEDEATTMQAAHAAARSVARSAMTDAPFAANKRGAAAGPADEEGEAVDADAPLLPPGWQPPRGMRQVPAHLPSSSGPARASAAARRRGRGRRHSLRGWCAWLCSVWCRGNMHT
jgi:hypothetical protein